LSHLFTWFVYISSAKNTYKIPVVHLLSDGPVSHLSFYSHDLCQRNWAHSVCPSVRNNFNAL